MFRIVLIAAVLVSSISVHCDVMADGSLLHTFFGRNHTSDQLNQKGEAKPIRVDASSMDMKVKTKATINKGLRKFGFPAMLGPPKVQQQSVWVKGHGFVEITDQAQRQVNENFRRASNGHSTKQAVASQQAKLGRADDQPTSPIQPTVDLLRTADSVDWMTRVDFDSLSQHALTSLMMDPAKVQSSEYRSQLTTIKDELQCIDHAALVDHLFLGIDRRSLTFVGGSRSKTGGLEIRVIEANHPDVPPCVVSIKPVQVGDNSHWLIEDIFVPTKNLTLSTLYQYRLIENLPQMPTYAAWVHPGRLDQSSQVSLILNADPHDPISFAKVWQSLAEDTKTWPLAKSMFASYEKTRIATQQSSRRK